MSKKTSRIVRKAFINKRNNQLSVTIPKKKLKSLDPSIKFSDKLFLEVRLVKGKKNNGRT